MSQPRFLVLPLALAFSCAWAQPTCAEGRTRTTHAVSGSCVPAAVERVVKMGSRAESNFERAPNA